MPVHRSPQRTSNVAHQRATKQPKLDHATTHDPDATIIVDFEDPCADQPMEAATSAPSVCASAATNATLDLNATKQVKRDFTREETISYIKGLKQPKPPSKEDERNLFKYYGDMIKQVIDILELPTKTVVKEQRQAAVERLKDIDSYITVESLKPPKQLTPVPCDCASAGDNSSNNINKVILEEIKNINKQLNEAKVRETISYASALSKPISNSSPVNLSKPVTPKSLGNLPVSYALIVKSDKIKTSGEIRDKITKSKICPKAKASPKGMFNIGKDRVKLNFASPEEREKVIKQLKDLPDLETEIVKKRKPLIQLKWIPPWVKPDDVVRDYLLPQNDSLKKLVPNLKASDLKVRFKLRPHKYRSKDPKQLDQEPYHLVMEAESQVYRALMKIKEICIDTKTCQALPFLSFKQCYKCCSFGHLAKHCGTEQAPSKPICAYCTGDHAFKDCKQLKDPKQKGKPCCFRCKESSKQNKSMKFDHMATSPNCPHVIEAKHKFSLNVDW